MLVLVVKLDEIGRKPNIVDLLADFDLSIQNWAQLLDVSESNCNHLSSLAIGFDITQFLFNLDGIQSFIVSVADVDILFEGCLIVYVNNNP
jgi:hypothetical protein